MSEKSADSPLGLSRRALLQTAASAVAALAAAARPADAQMKVSKESVEYEDQPDGGKRCGVCAHFMPPDACRFVEGPISPQGFCSLFTPASQQG
jgi:hypothetical protein